MKMLNENMNPIGFHEPKLKELYKDYFRVGVACEAVSSTQNSHSEIGNPAKEEIILNQFNSMTCANEMKPLFNMGVRSKEKREDYLPYEIYPYAKEMLEWAKERKMMLRAHVFVWHKQCPEEAFCKNYIPIRTEEGHLDPNCLVDRETMLKRLESFIDTTMEYMYKNGYATLIYAWDVVNEAFEPFEGIKDGYANSYWYRIIGKDFIYYTFKYAREAEIKWSKNCASLYDINPTNEEELKTIQPKLFYNDYNEFIPEKREYIIKGLNLKENGHGSVISDGYIDGIGMQGHLTDNSNIDEFINAMKIYNDMVDEIHITELDVKRNGVNCNADYYHAVFYKKLFEALIKAKKEHVNLTSVTFWGLTDDTSWLEGKHPLLFNEDLSKKLAFDAVVYAITGGDLGEPEYVNVDFSDQLYDCGTRDAEGNLLSAQDMGFSARGFCELTIQESVVFDGPASMQVSNRKANWTGPTFSVSDFIGQTIEVSAWVKTKDEKVRISADIEQEWPNIVTVDTSSGEWTQLRGIYQVPSNMSSLFLYIETENSENTCHDMYIDHIRIHHLGLAKDCGQETSH